MIKRGDRAERREFLKGVAVAALTLGLASPSAGGRGLPGVMVIAPERCMGCEACVVACHVGRGLPEGRWDTRVEERRWNGAPGGRLFVPRLCNHCRAAPCVEQCPVGAMRHGPGGLVLVEAEACIGCGTCVRVCPFGAVRLAGGRSAKCDLCVDRLEQGLVPRCVASCPSRARLFSTPSAMGEAGELVRRARAAGLGGGRVLYTIGEVAS